MNRLRRAGPALPLTRFPPGGTMTALVAGIDSSTQFFKIIIRDSDTGALMRATAGAAHPDMTEVDPVRWWEAPGLAIKQAGGLADVAAVAVAGQQHGMVCLDENAEAVRPALLWNDTRSATAAAELLSGLDAIRAAGPQIRRILLAGGGARSEAARRIAPALLGAPVLVPAAGEFVADDAARQAARMLTGGDGPPMWPPTASPRTCEAEPQPEIRAATQWRAAGSTTACRRPEPRRAGSPGHTREPMEGDRSWRLDTPSRPLGRTGLEVSAICIGTSPLAGMQALYGYDVSPQQAEATIRAVLAGPFTFMDTSNNYGGGDAERRIGSVLRADGGLPDGFVLHQGGRDPVRRFSADRVQAVGGREPGPPRPGPHPADVPARPGIPHQFRGGDGTRRASRGPR